VYLVEGRRVAVQDGHQVDQRIVAHQRGSERSLVVRIEFKHRQQGQVPQMARRVGAPPRRRRHRPTLAHHVQFFGRHAADSSRLAPSTIALFSCFDIRTWRPVPG